MVKIVDRALAKREMEHLDFHGVGGDWLVTPKEPFLALLDKLESCRDQLWVTDPLSWHKYQTERNGAKVAVLQAGEDRIRLQLSSEADPAFYDLPLTLSTRVPSSWKTCVIRQGTKETKAAVADGSVRFAAVPSPEEITLAP